jgi:succinate dehydrogenase / fumarate reductase cytochrome b subunit
MANAKPAVNRPLSPHLSIYRMQINMVMSIVHRITGAANYFGTAFFAAWLMAAAVGPKPYASINELLSHPIGMVLVFGFTWSVIHHMVGGVRHFIWDTGRGFSIPQVNALSWMTIIVSLILTVFVWAWGLGLRGVI